MYMVQYSEADHYPVNVKRAVIMSNLLMMRLELALQRLKSQMGLEERIESVEWMSVNDITHLPGTEENATYKA